MDKTLFDLYVDTRALTPGQTRTIWVENVPFALLLTKEVFTNKDGSTGERYLVTDDLTLTDDHITKLYQKRWSAEVYHEALKQNASLEKSPPGGKPHNAITSLPVCVPISNWKASN